MNIIEIKIKKVKSEKFEDILGDKNFMSDWQIELENGKNEHGFYFIGTAEYETGAIMKVEGLTYQEAFENIEKFKSKFENGNYNPFYNRE